LEKKEKELKKKENFVEERTKDLEVIKKKHIEKLEKVAVLTKDQAKKQLLELLDGELAHEKAVKIVETEKAIKEDSKKRAREIIALAIQKCAVDSVSETTVSVVTLPNDDMKGRIIGREGRNIRSIETLTGVDIVIDDTPEAITLSCFDPIRRETARIAIENLISDGRIHPTKIEESIEKAKKQLEETIKEEGEKALIEANVTFLDVELIKLLGRLKYRTSYGQNVLKHSIEVSQICGIMASELGLSSLTARRAGLLHDIGKALDHTVEGSHVDIGVDILKRYKESEEIVHAVKAHHGGGENNTALSFIVQAADAISAARPGARRENIENYVKRLEELEKIATSFDGVSKSFAVQAGREVRIMVEPDKVTDEAMIVLSRDICKKIEAELNYPGRVRVTLIRESRAVEYAR
jgi:ribonuclease Y